jgi:TetR/AcrR family transcriptional repressor for divergent bdcA
VHGPVDEPRLGADEPCDHDPSHVAARYPAEADRLTEFVSTTMTGLSAKARDGYTLDQLLGVARLAGAAVSEVLRA